MSSDMNLSSLLQSEIYCAPAQVVLIDTRSNNGSVAEILKSLDITADRTSKPALTLFSVPSVILFST